LNKHKSLIIPNIQKILYFYSIWQPIYTDILNDNPNVEFIQGYKNECELLDSKPKSKLINLINLKASSYAYVAPKHELAFSMENPLKNPYPGKFSEWVQ
jgi:hypothetical protein